MDTTGLPEELMMLLMLGIFTVLVLSGLKGTYDNAQSIMFI